MKEVILAKHTGKTSDDKIHYWEYDHGQCSWYTDNGIKGSKFAIVDSEYGYQLVKIVGFAEVNDDFEAEKRVVSFLNNKLFPIEELEKL